MNEPTLDMSPAAVLNRAADYIEEHGWTTGTFERDGQVCVMGAISRARRGAPAAVTHACINALRGVVDTNGTLTRWNDRQTSGKPVIAALRAAAEAAT